VVADMLCPPFRLAPKLAHKRHYGKLARPQHARVPILPDLPTPDAATHAKRRPVKPRDAASLIIVRPGAAGPEVLMGMRGARHRFMPNRLVFPGGRVDRADRWGKFATPLRPDTRAHLEKSATPAKAQAIAIAVARELQEETGLTLGTPPQLDGLFYLLRAVTPPVLPMRFNARFLIVDADRVSGTLAGSGELENLRYYPVADALALDLADITRHVLENLLTYLALSPTDRAARTLAPLYRYTGWTLE
jgi:8-oxo-dGTP pyrophosphatase MutT (NUDIX family)